MIAASISCLPSALNTAPRPALKAVCSSKRHHRRFDRVERRAAFAKHRPSRA